LAKSGSFIKSSVIIVALVFTLLGCGGDGANDSSQNGGLLTTKNRKKNALKLDPNKYPDMVYIPPGEFTMGANPKQEKAYPASLGFTNAPYHNESPSRRVYLDGFYIDKYEVTIGEYAKFVKATGREFPEPIQNLNVEKYEKYPMSCVTWYDAADYAKWANKLLPTEAEWEKAARGTDGRRYPWGNKIDKNKANFSKQGIFPVGTYKEDVSFYGVMGMGGSLDEWVRDWFKVYPGHDKNCVEDDSDFGEEYKVYRGGSWGGLEGHLLLFEYTARTAYRGYEIPSAVSNTGGFRCVREK